MTHDVMIHGLVVLTVGFAVFLLLTGGVVKLVDRSGLERALAATPFHGPASNLVAASLPLVEIVLGLLLIVGNSRPLWAMLGGTLFAGFAVISATTNLEDCGCGPFVPQRSSLRIAVNSSMAVGLFATAILGSNHSVTDLVLATSSAALVAMVGSLILNLRQESRIQGERHHHDYRAI